VPIPIIFDSDGGVDDAAALWWACTNEETELVAVTAVAGNVDVEVGARNLGIVLEAAGQGDVPVAIGAADPIGPTPPLRRAAAIHGHDGLGDVDRLHAAKASEGFADSSPLPREFGRITQVERLTSAATGKDRAAGVDAVARRFLDRNHVGPGVVLLDLVDGDADALAGETAGDEGDQAVDSADALAVLDEIVEDDGIARERELVLPLRERADVVIDTSGLTAAMLRRKLAEELLPTRPSRLAITFESFGFKHGPIRDADLMLDVRFLPNPHYEPDLRPLTGDDGAVREFMNREGALDAFYERLYPLLDFLLPQYLAEGKAHLVVAIGCTGGRHRSVAIARDLARRYRDSDSYLVEAVHRDVARAI